MSNNPERTLTTPKEAHEILKERDYYDEKTKYEFLIQCAKASKKGYGYHLLLAYMRIAVGNEPQDLSVVLRQVLNEYKLHGQLDNWDK